MSSKQILYHLSYYYVDKDNKKLKNVLPWEIYVDGNEIVRNEPIKQIVWKQDKFPVINVPSDIDTSEVTRDEVTFIK